ncbi:glutathionylspermidine synthase family protein [Nitrosophilus alvini]|uniref:glutathionylspermidine synthase family protein n=1 Tax=Nitrosophilus alvini TaxID=2714855 RepID=UPI00190A42D7|nr:glutathionylspermidine synthase family protein [Nitrosophilus alvini]
MVRVKKVEPLNTDFLEKIGFYWHTDSDETPYISDELVVVMQDEAQAYYDAANELYDMYIEAAEYVIEKNLFHELNIPFNLVDIIKMSWENDVHWHIYGRFDFAGGIDGKPIKLLEFNADTPTSLFETAIIQWAILKYNSLDEMKQFNNTYEAIKENFKRLVTLEEDTSKFSEWYEGWKMLFSSIKGSIEDENTTRLLQVAASEAGFETDFAFAEDVEFSDEGIFYDKNSFEFWFKLIPWETIAIEEPELAIILTKIIENQKAIILNPAYTLLFQSKAMMKILWDMYPGHPLLLETSFEPLEGRPYVEKKTFGREGENTVIYDQNRNISAKKEGEYENFKSIYQEFVELPVDDKGFYYQAGVFFAYEGCGLGFRKGGLIIDNMSKFVGHIIE